MSDALLTFKNPDFLLAGRFMDRPRPEPAGDRAEGPRLCDREQRDPRLPAAQGDAVDNVGVYQPGQPSGTVSEIDGR